MTNLLDRFSKTQLGNESYIIDYISTINPSGDFTKIEKINVILKSWFNILITPKRTVDHDPEFGCGIQRYIFKQVDGFTSNEIKDEIIYSLNRYDNRASIEKIIVEVLPNKKGFYIEIHVDYEGETSSLGFTLDENSFFTQQ